MLDANIMNLQTSNMYEIIKVLKHTSIDLFTLCATLPPVDFEVCAIVRPSCLFCCCIFNNSILFLASCIAITLVTGPIRAENVKLLNH